ncbi:sigma-70 family RNA polymerase sigma factor [Aestuariibius sp. 2305UL40-4]|uniref:sigma-70 family RNA polymerase sigma factor n=1 Tax=Aestuariibius violaceus TaxID=3234132 RepID=UPI00345EFADA
MDEATSQYGASDDVLLAAFANGDLTAARLLTDRLAPRILGHARRALGDPDEAEDVTQEVMMRLWRMAPDWTPGGAKVSTWTYRVAVNLCIDRLRARRRAGPPLDDIAEPADERPSVEAELHRKARAAALTDALAQLPERQAQAVRLRHLEGLGNPEIGEIMDIGVAAVESLIARGKRALAASLSELRPQLGLEDDGS